MRRLVVITDQEPTVKWLWNSWECSSGRIEGDTLTLNMRDKSVLTVRAVDPQMVADIALSHDPSSEIVKGKLGIQSVEYAKPQEDPAKGDAKTRLVRALKDLLDEIDR